MQILGTDDDLEAYVLGVVFTRVLARRPNAPARGTIWGMSGQGPLSTNLDDPSAVPYFLWDEPMSVSELRRRLKMASPPEKARLLGRVLREARDPDVWKFTTPEEVARSWPALAKHLGRRRAFWEFLLTRWSQQGRLVFDAAR